MDTHASHHGNRVEDLRLVTGAGKYAADWSLPGQLYAAFVRADRAHAEIVSVNTGKAARHPGVRRVYTGADALAAGYTKYFVIVNFPGRGGNHIIKPPRPVLAARKVRHVGDAVAMVVADTAAAAQDAAELVEIEYRDLPAVVSAEAALAAGAPQLHEEAPGNLAFDLRGGQRGSGEGGVCPGGARDAVEAPGERASRPARWSCAAARCATTPKDGTYHVHVCIQGINMMRKQLAAITDVPEEKIVVHAQDIGGSFGQRSAAYPEYCMQMLAAKELGRPVRWISTRSEGFMSDTHGRANTVSGELALDRDGKFLALKLDWIADMGGYLSATGSASHTRNPSTCMTGVYRIPALYGRFRLAFTNTVPVAAYRGAGRPDIAYVIERLVSQAAAELKIDPAELRRRNFIPKRGVSRTRRPPARPTRRPISTACWSGRSSSPTGRGFAARRRKSEQAGKLRGLGIATVIENTGAGLFPQGPGRNRSHALPARSTSIRCRSRRGRATRPTFGMIVAEALGVPLERVRIRQGVKPLVGNHTGGSRSTAGAGSACKLAALKLIEQARSLAALKLEVEPSQVEYSKGVFQVRGAKKKIGLFELASRKPINVMAEGSFGSTFPNGCHITEVEIDPATGVARIVAYSAVDDCGNVINHTIVEGQVHGAVTQGAGQIFSEQVVYDRETGQLLTGSFMDYCMPRAGLVPDIRMQDAPAAERQQRARREGRGRIGLHRLDALARQRGGGRAAAARRRAPRHADDAGEAVARDPRPAEKVKPNRYAAA